VNVSSPNKLIFPADGVTKADLVDHYRLVGEHMLDFVAGRPLTRQRFPRGIEAKGFMQKNAAEHFPDSIRRLAVPKRGGGETVYPVVSKPMTSPIWPTRTRSSSTPGLPPRRGPEGRTGW